MGVPGARALGARRGRSEPNSSIPPEFDIFHSTQRPTRGSRPPYGALVALCVATAVSTGAAGCAAAGTGPETGAAPNAVADRERAPDAGLAMTTSELDGTWDVRAGNPALPELLATIDGGTWHVRLARNGGSSVATLRAEMVELHRIRLHAVGGWLALCASPGLYAWRRRGNVIELTAVEDDCTRRRGGLDGAELTPKE